MEWLDSYIDGRIEIYLDEIDLEGEGMKREEVESLLTEEAVVTYGGDIGLRVYDDGEEEDE